jgi:hypothetical protein
MREIIIIETQNGRKIKEYLEREQEIYRAFREEENEEEIYRRDMRLANQDQERQKEIEFWDKVQNQDNTELKENDDE